jgi:hypothetical protein
VPGNIGDDAAKQAVLAFALMYAACGMRVFPVTADKKPLIKWKEGASADPAAIEAMWRRWPYADIAWALPAGVVVLDIDVKHGLNGYRDFVRLTGSSAFGAETPMTTMPSGGLQLFYAGSKTYKNAAPAIPGTGLDTRAEGGLVVLPGPATGGRG